MRLGLDFLKFFPVEVGWGGVPMIYWGHFITPPRRCYMWKIEERMGFIDLISEMALD